MDTKNLVFTSAGKHSKHVNYWLREPEKRNFDLWVVYYPEGEPTSGYADNTELFLQRRGSKYENLAYVYDNFRDRLNKYDSFFIIDDDIEISTLAINKLFEIHARWKLDLSQPAYSLKSSIAYPHLVWRPFSTLRFVSFVENGVTAFSRKTFHACAPIFKEINSGGWGADFIFTKCISDEKPRIAVIDEVVCHHPFRQSELDCYLPRNMQKQEGEKLMKKYGVDYPYKDWNADYPFENLVFSREPKIRYIPKPIQKLLFKAGDVFVLKLINSIYPRLEKNMARLRNLAAWSKTLVRHDT